MARKLFTYSSYYSRPLWDSGLRDEFKRWNVTPFLGVDSSPDWDLVCSIHNFTRRHTPPRVFDAFLFNSELDLLEIRLHELDPVVDKFILFETSCSFMGLQKKLFFEENKSRFSKFLGKIIHKKRVVDNCSLESTSWSAESSSRSSLIQAARELGNARDGDLFHMSDLDELPHLSVLSLLKSCEFGDRIHLALSSYRYSFEFRVWPEFVFRSTVSVLGQSIPDRKITARFGNYLTTKLLGGAGWHCSFCIRDLDDIIGKMKGYSHNDRTDFDPHSTEKPVLQNRICIGEDPFGFPPEAHNYYALASMIQIAPMTGAEHAPKYVRENPEKFRFLLPGGCRNR